MSAEDTQLRKVLSLSHAVGLAFTIVIGGGLLVLPGLVYQQTGSSAIYVWLLDLLLMVPLLIILVKLGTRWPSAGGIAGFLHNAFSRRYGMATEVLLIGTVGLSTPAIALIGGQYLAMLLGKESAIFQCAFLLLFIAILINWYGGAISGHIQRILAFTLCGILFVVALIALILGDYKQGVAFAPIFEGQTWYNALPATGLVLYALTGWESLSHTLEEYHNPQRHFSLSVTISFVIVAVLYLMIAIATQLTLPQSDPQIAVTPIALLLSSIIGPLGAVFISTIAIFIALANLVSSVWVSSRLVFSSAREGILPRHLMMLHPSCQTPRIAILFCAVIFFAVLCVNATGLLNLQDLLRFSGQNYFFLYAMSVLVYLKVAKTIMAYTLGIVGLIVVLAMSIVFAWEILYPLALLSIGFLLAIFVRK